MQSSEKEYVFLESGGFEEREKALHNNSPFEVLNLLSSTQRIQADIKERYESFGYKVISKPWWGEKENPKMRNAGLVIGKQYFDESNRKVCEYRLDWEPIKYGEKGIHHNLNMYCNYSAHQ